VRRAWIRRRGWLVAITVVACTVSALAIAAILPDKSTAEAVLIVPAASSAGAIGNPDDAAKAAGNYAQLIPRDDAILSAIGAKLGLRPRALEQRLSVKNDPGHSLLRLQYRGRTAAEAVNGARTAATTIAGDERVSDNIGLGAMTIVRLARAATRTGRAPFTYVAESIMVVPASPRQTGPGLAGEASNLATTYADLIPEDRTLLEHLATKLGLSVADVRSSITVTHDFNTSLLRAGFSDLDPQVALSGAKILAESVTGPSPVSPRVSPGSLAIVHLPTTATVGAMSKPKVVVLGIILGLALGLVLLLAWERADSRIDDVATFGAEAGCGASELEGASDLSLAALLDRWAGMVDKTPTRIALLPVTTSAEAATAEAAQRLGQVGTPMRLVAGAGATPAQQGARITLDVGGVPGSAAAGETLALTSDVIVLVATKGSRVADLRSALAVLEQFGARPSWALLATPPAKPSSAGAPADVRPQKRAPTPKPTIKTVPPVAASAATTSRRRPARGEQIDTSARPAGRRQTLGDVGQEGDRSVRASEQA
jgi:hypothetical protein